MRSIVFSRQAARGVVVAFAAAVSAISGHASAQTADMSIRVEPELDGGCVTPGETFRCTVSMTGTNGLVSFDLQVNVASGQASVASLGTVDVIMPELIFAPPTVSVTDQSVAVRGAVNPFSRPLDDLTGDLFSFDLTVAAGASEPIVLETTDGVESPLSPVSWGFFPPLAQTPFFAPYATVNFGSLTLDLCVLAPTGCSPADVFPPATGDGRLDSDDVIEFVNAFNAGTLETADVFPPATGDGRLDSDDVIEFVNQFNLGCP